MLRHFEDVGGVVSVKKTDEVDAKVALEPLNVHVGTVQDLLKCGDSAMLSRSEREIENAQSHFQPTLMIFGFVKTLFKTCRCALNAIASITKSSSLVLI